MALPPSGQLSLSQIQTEFGGSNPIGMSEYYRNGLYVPDTYANSNIPTGGQISVSNFYGGSSQQPLTFLYAFASAPSSGTPSITIPSGSAAAGDLAYIFSYRRTSNTAPSIPAGWTGSNPTGANSNSAMYAYKTLTSGDIGSTVTSTNATAMAIIIYRYWSAIYLGGSFIYGASSDNPPYWYINAPTSTPYKKSFVFFIADKLSNSLDLLNALPYINPPGTVANRITSAVSSTGNVQSIAVYATTPGTAVNAFTGGNIYGYTSWSTGTNWISTAANIDGLA